MSLESWQNRLLSYALSDFEGFCKLPGIDTKAASVCLLRMEGKTYGQIASMMSISKSKVRRILNNCVSKTDTLSRE